MRTRKTTKFIASVFGLLISLSIFSVPALGAPTPAFNATRDGKAVEKCFAAYLALGEATYGATAEPQRGWFSRASAGAQRIFSFVNESANANPAFFGDVAIANAATRKSLSGMPASDPTRQKEISALNDIAVDCDAHLDRWVVAQTSAAEAIPSVQTADPTEVANSLVEATRSVCVPYVADGEAIDALAERYALSRRVDNVNGAQVTRYLYDAPGHPVITPTIQKDFGVGPDGNHHYSYKSCWLIVRGLPTVEAISAYKLFRERLVLNRYQTTPAHYVDLPGTVRIGNAPSTGVCVLGRQHVVIQVSNPEEKDPPGFAMPHDYIEVHVDSAPEVLKTDGCVPPEPADLVATPLWNETVCLGTVEKVPDQQIDACTALIAAGFDPQSTWMFFNARGAVYYKISRIEAAIDDFTQAIRLKPDDPDLYDNRGNMYFKQGRFELAIADYEAALKLKPDDKRARAFLDRARAATAAAGKSQP